MNVLVKFQEAKRALELARTVDEVKDVRDKAEALRLYMQQAGESLEMQNAVAEIKLRAYESFLQDVRESGIRVPLEILDDTVFRWGRLRAAKDLGSFKHGSHRRSTPQRLLRLATLWLQSRKRTDLTPVYGGTCEI